MKPVVSSLLALAIATTTLSAMARSPEKSTHHAKATSAKAGKHKVEKRSKRGKCDDDAAVAVARVKDGEKKAVLHHASNVDLGGGHKEPKIERGVSVVPASMITKSARGRAKLARVSHVSKPIESHEAHEASDKSAMPPLPSPNAPKGALKNVAERKKDSGDASSKEDFADLVARIRAPLPPAAKATCAKEPVEIIRGPEIQRFSLTKCDGSIAPLAVENLSILVRPGSAPRPTTPVAELAKNKGPELAHGIRRVDPRLVERIQAVVDHFHKPGAPSKLSIISGYRPTSVGSMHATGRAIDFRVEGVKNEEVVSFCKTLGDTGCGYYPNSSFVHIDVRDQGAGHVAWIDASGPGESPRYVSAWPPPERAKSKDKDKDNDITRPSDVLEHTSAKRSDPAFTWDRETTPEPVDAHPAGASGDDEDEHEAD